MADLKTASSTYGTSGIDTHTAKTNDPFGDNIDAEHSNRLASAILNIETILGVGETLKGSVADLVARLAVSMSAAGEITKVNFFPSGTPMLFQQTLAPTGWTKQTTHNDKTLRVVSGSASSGGATAFSSVFGSSITTGSHTITISQMPAHTHTTDSTGAHTHDLDLTVAGGAGSIKRISGNTDGDASTLVDLSAGAHTHTAQSTGGGTGHTHTMSMDIHFVDLIIASKD